MHGSHTVTTKRTATKRVNKAGRREILQERRKEDGESNENRGRERKG